MFRELRLATAFLLRSGLSNIVALKKSVGLADFISSIPPSSGLVSGKVKPDLISLCT